MKRGDKVTNWGNATGVDALRRMLAMCPANKRRRSWMFDLLQAIGFKSARDSWRKRFLCEQTSAMCDRADRDDAIKAMGIALALAARRLEVLREVKALYESGAFDERHTGTCVVCNQGAPHFQHCGLGKVLDKIARELETP